jgi:hypothetical protein
MESNIDITLKFKQKIFFFNLIFYISYILYVTENDITIESMTDITDDHLQELKISIGHRIIFKNKIQVYKEKKELEKNVQKQNIDVVS